MSYLLALQDSELAQALREGDDIILRFAAALVQQPALREQGYVQHLQLRLGQAHSHGPLTQSQGRVRSARLRMAGQTMSLLAVPGAHPGPCVLELQIGFEPEWRLEAAQLVASFEGDPAYRSSWAC
jgi:hypothetical protein